MLRPLEEPIRWKTEILVRRARHITQNNRPKTLRQALRVVARYGLRRTRAIVERLKDRRLDYATRCVGVMVKYGFELRNLKKGNSLLDRAVTWLQSQPVTIEQSGHSVQAFHFNVLYRLTTTHLTQNVHVDLAACVRYPVLRISLHPLTPETHLRFLNDLTQPIDYPQLAGSWDIVRIKLGSPVRPGGAAMYFLREPYVDTNGQRQTGMHTSIAHNLPRLRVILRTLLRLDDETDEPGTPAS